MDLRRLSEQDATAYRELRSEALELEPQAFTASTAEHRALTPEEIKQRLGPGSSGDNFILGAFDDDRLVGMAGFFRRQGEKICHRGGIWGVYVAKPYQGKGLGYRLLEELIRQVRFQPGLEQVALGVSSVNYAAKRLYKSLGFEIYGRERRALKLGDAYVDEELMVLYLQR